MKKIIAVIVVFFMLSILVMGCTQQESEKTVSLNVNLKWLHQAQFAGNYVAEKKGYYESSNLDVTLIEGGVDSPSIEQVLSGNADIGIAGADDIVVSISKGNPIKAIAVIYKISPVVYFSLMESNITTPYDFINKTIGVKHGTGTDYSYIAILGNLGINRSFIKEEEVGYDLTKFYNGSIDVWPGFRINEPHVAELAGYNVSLILPEDWGVKIYADVLFTTNTFLENNKDVVKDFLTETLKGWQYAIEHQNEAVSITMEYVKDTSTQDHQQYMLEHSIPLIHTGDSKLGVMDDTSWESVIDVLLLNNVIDQEPELSNIYTNEYII